MPHSIRKLLIDVALACAETQTFCAGKDLATFRADRVLQLAVERQFEIIGEALCRLDESAVLEPGRERFPDLELAVALMSGAQTYDPQFVRCAAQLLGAPGIEPSALARSAAMERCGPIVRHIAEAALRFDPDRCEFWTKVLAALPANRPVRPGLLPHPTRFIVQSGVANPRRPAAPRAVWLRPVREKV